MRKTNEKSPAALQRHETKRTMKIQQKQYTTLGENSQAYHAADKLGDLCLVLVALIGTMMILWIGCGGAASAETLYVSVSADSVLNVRVHPARDAEVHMYLERGTEVDAGERSGHWVYISRCGEQGWAYDAYLSGRAPKAEPETATVRTNGRVRVRKEPSGKVCGYVHDGDRLTVSRWTTDADGQEWAYADGIGYISADYVEVDDE